MPLPYFTKENRILMIALGGFVFSILYLGTGHNPILSPHRAQQIVLDQKIMFIPWTIVLYLSQFCFLLVGVLKASNDKIATQTYYSYIFATMIASIIFTIYPTTLPRVYPLSNYFNAFFEFLYTIDVPNNFFPSLHTTLALICANGLKDQPKWRVIAPVWAGAIIVSTLTTKQHVLLDVAGGILLYLFITYYCSQIINGLYNEKAKLRSNFN